jgi:hypothetical protein
MSAGRPDILHNWCWQDKPQDKPLTGNTKIVESFTVCLLLSFIFTRFSYTKR